MRLTFFGAAGEVTGSCYLLETPSARVLIDFGLHQGSAMADRRNRRFPPCDARRLDAVVLTHAHLDHCGRLPLLPGAGFSQRIHATPASIGLADILLRDAARLQMQDAERLTRRRTRRGVRPAPPLFVEPDVDRVMRLFTPLPYGSPREVAPGVMVRFVDAGHIIGSASAEVTVRENGSSKTIAFSGDIGPRGSPLLRDPVPLTRADAVVMESTYGDRRHRVLPDSVEELAQVVERARAEGGKVLIPSFAVGRTQSLIFHFGNLVRAGRLPGLEVVVDSPMALEATDLYRRHPNLFDEESAAMIAGGIAPLSFAGLRASRTPEESAALNADDGGVVIIAGSGMATGGRILHHFKHGLWKPTTRVVIVGFQAAGSLGRRLVDGARVVKVLGEAVAVRARIHTINGFSAHAGQDGLVEWAANFRDHPPGMVMLTHGEDASRAALARVLESQFGYRVERPTWGEVREF